MSYKMAVISLLKSAEALMEQEVNDMQISKASQDDISITISIKHAIGSIVPMFFATTADEIETKANFAMQHIKDAAKNKKK